MNAGGLNIAPAKGVVPGRPRLHHLVVLRIRESR
jgi:hypothetical protein